MTTAHRRSTRFVLCLALYSSANWAFNDPMKPLDVHPDATPQSPPQDTPLATPSPLKKSDFVLSAILITAAEKIAFINGQAVAEGDCIRQATVASIHAYHVELRQHGVYLIIELAPQVKTPSQHRITP